MQEKSTRLRLADRKLRRAVKRAKAGLKRRQAAETQGMVPLAHNSFISRKGFEASPVGSVNPGGNVFRPNSKADKPVYSIDREPRIGSKPSASLKRQTIKHRFSSI